MNSDQGENSDNILNGSSFDGKWWQTPANRKEPSSADTDLESRELLNNNNHNEDDDDRTPMEKVRFLLSSMNDDGGDDGALRHRLDQHSLFCQMDILTRGQDSETVGWRETARWLKYEEKLEDSGRWSKPHVSTVLLHALFEIRKSIADHSAAVILNVAAKDGCLHQKTGVCENCFTLSEAGINGDRKKQREEIYRKQSITRTAVESVVQTIVQTLKTECRIDEIEASKLVGILTTPHKHQHRSAKRVTSSLNIKDSNQRFLKNPSTASFISQNENLSPEDLKSYKPNKKLTRKIIQGAEAANILVGQADFLIRPLICFVRLATSSVLADFSEVSLPTRFIAIILGPDKSNEQYEEMGRAIALLLSDKVFAEVAYCSTDRQDFLDGVDAFIYGLSVLPPSLWDPDNRLEPPDHVLTMAKIQQRLEDDSQTASKTFAPGHDESCDPSLRRSGRLFGGLCGDIRRRYPLYWSDIKDGLNLQCFATIIFMYFACITPIVTFGGLLGIATENYQGTMETLVSGFVCGILYALLSGQPLTIIGATGPLLVFEAILYQICNSYDIQFLPFRMWVGLWTVAVLVVIVMFDLSALVVYITRFTEESFSVLISAIFIYEAFAKCFKITEDYPVHRGTIRQATGYFCYCAPTNETIHNVTWDGLNVTVQTNTHYSNWTTTIDELCTTNEQKIIISHMCVSEANCLSHPGWTLVGPACGDVAVTGSVADVFFFSCFLFVGTFVIALAIKDFKNSSFFPNIVRSTVSDFAVFTAIMLCTGLDIFVGIDTPKLHVPDKFVTTRSDRSWVINPFEVEKVWLIPLAIVPAALATTLIFLDQQITVVIVNRKEHMLKKGHGYHLDLLTLAGIVAVCSCLGLPWFVAATVRSITHVRSLLVESSVQAPGEKVKLIGVREQRVTGLCVHILIGLSVLATKILQYVPMPVLYGVFLYMGWTSLRGVQFVDRILLFFMPVKHQPDRIFLRHVPTMRVHLFTLIQIAGMTLMWTVKSTKAVAILFPVTILALCAIRKAMDFFFSQYELFWLDHLLPDQTHRDREDAIKSNDSNSEPLGKSDPVLLKVVYNTAGDNSSRNSNILNNNKPDLTKEEV